jgi:hypothetical protein
MDSDDKNCVLCELPPPEVKMGPGSSSGVVNSIFNPTLAINCPRCGQYEFVFNGYKDFEEIKKALSCASRQAWESGRPLRITPANFQDIARPHMRSGVSENQQRLLQEIAKRTGRPDKAATLNLDWDFTLIDCYDRGEFEWYLEWLKIEKLAFPTAVGRDVTELTLSMDGWRRAQPSSRPGGIPGQCFVAMWFSEEMREVYDRGIEPAITQAGFRPLRVDMVEHNNQITDEIMAGIRNSEFVVADFTGQRLGVYYEAGFAKGLGREVIWCCRKDEVHNLHFDTNHMNHIVWTTPEDLHEKLRNRIAATIIQKA